MQYILTCNAGSSSVKAATYLVKGATLKLVATASIENIGQGIPLVRVSQPDGSTKEQCLPSIHTHASASVDLAHWLVDHLPKDGAIAAIGYRVVHGGTLYYKPTVLTTETVKDLATLKELDPDHMPAALESIAALQKVFPQALHVGCFDTAFFRDIPKVAQLIPLPKRFRDKGLRRYGFHGLSYASILEDFTTHEGTTAAHGRVVMAHLGSGASLCALRSGKPVDMTMGFTPAGGIVMSTRSGDIDPGIAWFLHRQAGQSPAQFNHMVNAESGLLAISGKTAGMHALLDAQATDSDAAQAIEYFCYQVAKAIGSLSAVLGGVDSLIFSGGIGERSAEIRQRICANLAYLGIELDKTRNKTNGRLISKDVGGAGVHVIPTDESLMIARQTHSLTKGAK